MPLITDVFLTPKPLGQSELIISPMALGAFKFGRNQKVKYPSGDGYPLCSEADLEKILMQSKELGINLIDVAPSYGIAEKRIGQALKRLKLRSHFCLSTKVGEIFDGKLSSYDYSKKHMVSSIESSLKTLGGDVLEMVFLHCSKEDFDIIQSTDAIETLIRLKEKGMIQTIGVSTMSTKGAIAACHIAEVDALMIAFNLHYQHETPAIEKAKQKNKGVLIKKALLSGHLDDKNSPKQCLKAVFEIAKADCVIIGTDNIHHLQDNAQSIFEITQS